jgi:hypothetical protein
LVFSNSDYDPQHSLTIFTQQSRFDHSGDVIDAIRYSTTRQLASINELYSIYEGVEVECIRPLGIGKHVIFPDRELVAIKESTSYETIAQKGSLFRLLMSKGKQVNN